MAGNQRCPKCGYPDIYLGATRIECGYDEKCENYTEKQAGEVQKLLDVRFPSAAEVQDQMELDLSLDDTQPFGIPLPLDGTD